MDQWDEDQQDWTNPSPPDEPPPGSRTLRLMIVTIVAVLLSAAAGTGIWLLVRDGGTPSVADALPGAPRSGLPVGTEAASAEPGDVPDPCAAVDDALIQQWYLTSGQTETPSSDGGGLLKICSWQSFDGDSSVAIKFTLMYTGNVPLSPAPTPIQVDGAPDAAASGNENGCVVQLPASFGKIFVYASPVDANRTGDMCRLAADFAGGLAPRLPT